jgi:hypothetical protein
LNFKTLKTIKAPHQKNFFFPFNCYDLAIREVTLTKVFSTHYWHSKVQGLTVGSRKNIISF